MSKSSKARFQRRQDRRPKSLKPPSPIPTAADITKIVSAKVAPETRLLIRAKAAGLLSLKVFDVPRLDEVAKDLAAESSTE